MRRQLWSQAFVRSTGQRWRAAGLPVEFHAYARGGHGFGMRVQHLPSDTWIDRFLQWHAALERAALSDFLGTALGAGFLDVFLALKRRECEKFGALVTDRDYAWYLDSV